MPTTKDPFALFNEKILADDVKLISWCPTADLVLLVSPNDTIGLYRNGVNKVWTMKNETGSSIKIITWKPNGKEFVIGCESGVVFKVDIVYHTPRMFQCWSPTTAYNNRESSSCAITSLVWINYEFKKKHMDIEGFDIDAFDLKSTLPVLREEPPEEPVSQLSPARRKKVQLPTKPLNNTEIQTLLFIGNAKGQIHIILNGIYPIGSIDINDSREFPAILNISVKHNVSSLQILTKSSKERENYFTASTIDTRFLEDKKEEIFGISEIQTKLNYLLQYTTTTLDVLRRHHASYSKLTSKIAEQAEYYMMEHYKKPNEHGSAVPEVAMPEVELTGTLAIGSVTETLRDFFMEYLTSQRIKQWESDTGHGHQNSLRVICDHILPACERIQLELSKLLGYSLWTQRYGDFLESSSVEKCIELVRQLVSQLHGFTRDLSSLAKTFQAFIKWITVVSQKVSDTSSVEFQNENGLCEDPELVLKFLNTDFIQDSLAEYFVSPPSKNEENTKKSPNNKKVVLNLVDLLNETKTCCSEMLERPSQTISKKMTVSSKISFRLDGVSVDNQPKDKVISFTTKQQDENQYIYYAFLQSNPDPKLIILKNDFVSDSAAQYALFNITEGKITDMEFFDDIELAVCIQKGQSTTLLSTMLLKDMIFKTLAGSRLTANDMKVARTQELSRMIDVKLGCNGEPRRRIMCVVGLNGLIKVLSMEEDEDDDGNEEEDEDEGKVDEEDAMSE